MLLNKGISVSYFIRLIKWDLVAIFCYAAVVGTLDHFSFFKNISVSLSIAALTGTLLSLLLAFRTSQSYERWWEARIVWGSIVNDSRTLIRQIAQFLPSGERKKEVIQQFAIRQSMWCYALGYRLRKESFPSFLSAYLQRENITGDHLPNALLSRHAADLAAVSTELELNANIQVQLEATLQRLTDAMGKCERIKSTIFPRSYSALIHFLIYVFMTILPFGLDDNNAIVEIILATLIPSLFIAIERTAILMQDPFENKPTDTAMTTIAQTIERNLAEMAALPVEEKTMATFEYYVM
ncbi:MAG TPA: bestrophin family ion channel [Flavisolibacter sp.]|nr:bestrophin family ion channel [Flavisolibacter sp.]